MSKHIEERPFEVAIPTADGKAIAEMVPIQVPMEWDEELNEWLITYQGLEKIEETKARHMGLLLPVEMLELRNRLQLTQKDIGELLQIGEKTWTRWESGNSRPSRSVNLLLRALYDRELSVEYLRRAKRQTELQLNLERWITVGNYTVGENKIVKFAPQGSARNSNISMDHLYPTGSDRYAKPGKLKAS